MGTNNFILNGDFAINNCSLSPCTYNSTTNTISSWYLYGNVQINNIRSSYSSYWMNGSGIRFPQYDSCINQDITMPVGTYELSYLEVLP
jgi:hypothetical protein